MKIIKNEWFLVWADDEEIRWDSPMEAKELIKEIMKKFDIETYWTGKVRDTGFGLEELALLEGEESSIEKAIQEVDFIM